MVRRSRKISSAAIGLEAALEFAWPGNHHRPVRLHGQRAIPAILPGPSSAEWAQYVTPADRIGVRACEGERQSRCRALGVQGASQLGGQVDAVGPHGLKGQQLPKIRHVLAQVTEV